MGRFIASVVRRVTQAENIEDLCKALIRCKGLLESRFVNKAAIVDCVKSRLAEAAVKIDGCSHLKALRINSIRLYRDTAACLNYLAFKAAYCTNASELTAQIEELVDLLKNRTTEPRTAILDEEEISRLLLLLQDKYNFIEALTYEKRLEIYLINRSHICFDSWLMTFKNTYTGRWINKWMVMSFAPVLNTPFCERHFVFLHEMGHILYNEVTEGGITIPPMFEELMAVLAGISRLKDRCVLPEVFSDLFAAAVMSGSIYAGMNPYSAILPKELLKLLDEYFLMLISRTGAYLSTADNRKILH